jgi:NYN domain
MAERGGFEVKTYERDAKNKEKAVDTELVAQGTLTIATTPAPAVLIIASGDRDFIPLVDVAHQLGWTVEMAAFSSAFTRDGEMAISVDIVRPLDGSLDLIGHCDFPWPWGLAGGFIQAMPTINLIDDELAAVTAVRRVIETDRFPRAPRLDPRRSALAKLDPATAPKQTPRAKAAPPAKADKRARR